ncbi:MAG: hypothetical protein E7553_01495 [Ruminococcaceae bacterium]|nr:hypothetical protein [Oscillospiraceae bacterium]
MKKIGWVLLLIAVIVSQVSCAATGIHTGEDPAVPDKTAYMTYVSEQHRVSVQIPLFESEAIDRQIQSYITERLRFHYDFEETMTLSATDIEAGDYSDCFVNIDCEITCNTEERISVLFEGMFNRKTAAHPLNCLFTLNIDPATGNRLMFGNVYAVNDGLYDCFRTYAEKALAVKADEQWMNGTEFSVLCPRERFLQGLEDEIEYQTYFTQTGVGFSYPVAHALGDYQTVEIPYEELDAFRL